MYFSSFFFLVVLCFTLTACTRALCLTCCCSYSAYVYTHIRSMLYTLFFPTKVMTIMMMIIIMTKRRVELWLVVLAALFGCDRKFQFFSSLYFFVCLLLLLVLCKSSYKRVMYFIFEEMNFRTFF